MKGGKGSQGPDWSPTPQQTDTMLLLFAGTILILWLKGILNLVLTTFQQ